MLYLYQLHLNKKVKIKTKFLRKAVHDLAPKQYISQALGGGTETVRLTGGERRPIE